MISKTAAQEFGIILHYILARFTDLYQLLDKILINGEWLENHAVRFLINAWDKLSIKFSWFSSHSTSPLPYRNSCILYDDAIQV